MKATRRTSKTEDPERIQTAAAARILGIAPRTVRDLASQGKLPAAAQIGRTWTFDRAKLRAFVSAKEAAYGAILTAENRRGAATRPGKRPAPGLSRSSHSIAGNDE